MKTILKFILVAAVALAAGFSRAQAPGPDDYPRFSQAELDSMIAPIALYPDSLLSQLLMAATYPRDVAEAAAWSRANSRIVGQEAVRAVAPEPWDPSVKSLVAFPQVLLMMDEHMEWTERLGDAFMSNPTGVSETIQVLRARADRAGNLRSSEEAVVTRDYGNYVIEPTQPDMVYVPYYDPRVVYGAWWWPNYAPVWWAPWPGYHWTAGYAGFAYGYGVFVGPGYWYTSFDWPRRYVRFNTYRPYYWRGSSHNYYHHWNSDRDHRRNTRGWQWSGSDNRQQWNGRDGRGTREGQRSVERASTPTTSGQRAYQPGGAIREIQPSAPQPQRSHERSGERQVAPQPQGQPLSRGAVGSPAPVQYERAPAPQGQPAPVQYERAPVQHERAPAPQVQRAPVREIAPAPAPAPQAREQRQAPPPESRSDRAPPDRSDTGSRSGGSNPAIRGNNRVARDRD